MLWLLVALLNPPLAPSGKPATKTALMPQVVREAAEPLIDVTTLTDDARIKAALGKRVRVVGVARACKLSACIVSDAATPKALEPLYVLSMQSWEDARLNTRVEVVGVLSQTGRFKAFKDAEGNHSQGTSGAVYHLKDAVIAPPK